MADFLLQAAEAAAARDGLTLRTRVEQGLWQVLQAREQPAAPFRRRQASFKGPGLRAGPGRRPRCLGPKVHDGRMAALCLQHTVSEPLTADRDFSRCPALKTRNPLLA